MGVETGYTPPEAAAEGGGLPADLRAAEKEPIEPQLDSVFKLFSPEGAKFSTSIEHSPGEVKRITLATHGQRLEHLVGGEGTQGILQEVAIKGISRFRLASKEENRKRGVPVTAYSHFGGGGAAEEGEAKVSFYNNGLAGYGEVTWVLPAFSVVERGGAVTLLYDPTQPSLDYSLAGMHGKTGEFGYFTPLGASIEAARRSERALAILEGMKNPTPSWDIRDAVNGIMSSYQGYSDKIGSETTDGYFQRLTGKNASELSRQDTDDYIKAQENRQREMLARALKTAQENSNNWGG